MSALQKEAPSSYPDTLILLDHWQDELPSLNTGGLLTEGGNEITTEANELDLEGEGTAPWIPTLPELKTHLRMEADDNAEDANLKTLLDSSYSLILKETGQDIRKTRYKASARTELLTYDFLQIDRSNVTAVNSVEVDGEAITAYELRHQRSQAVIARTDGECWGEEGENLEVRVGYTRGFYAGSAEANIIKQLVLEVAYSCYNHPGAASETPMRRTAAFNAGMNILRDRRSYLKWSV